MAGASLARTHRISGDFRRIRPYLAPINFGIDPAAAADRWKAVKRAEELGYSRVGGERILKRAC